MDNYEPLAVGGGLNAVGVKATGDKDVVAAQGDLLDCPGSGERAGRPQRQAVENRPEGISEIGGLVGHFHVIDKSPRRGQGVGCGRLTCVRVVNKSLTAAAAGNKE